MQTKQIIAVVPLALHTKFKFRAVQTGMPMSRVLRALIDGYLDGSFDVSDRLDRDRIRPQGRPAGAKDPVEAEGHHDFYDSLYEKINEVIES